MKKIFAILLCSGIATANAAHISGVAFGDRNANGVQDRNERGIANIPISNGDTIVLTDRKGRFVINSEPGESIFPILPSNYKMDGNKIGSANFFYNDPAKKADSTLNFALVGQTVKTSFRIASVGDVQVESDAELSYANRTVISELASRTDLDFYLFPGDLVNDNTEMLAKIKESLETLPSVSWSVAGNHDRDKGKVRGDVEYSRMYGYSDYAFNYGDVCFIMFNNVHNGVSDYIGLLSERQLRFLRNTLATIPKDRLVVISQHIPLKYTQNKEEIIKILSPMKRVLLLSGHLHAVSKQVFAPNICEQVVGAACGMWWVGERGVDAVPLALQRCGSPRNYFTVDFTPENYRLSFKGIGLDAEQQLDVWVKGEESIDTCNVHFANFEEGAVVVNVYAGGDSTKVKMSVDDGPWQELAHTQTAAPWISRIADWTKSVGYPTKYSRKAPVRNKASEHVWTGNTGTGLKAGAHVIKIEADDNYGLKIRATKVIRVE